MSIIEPDHPGGVYSAYHSETYNDNYITMTAGVAALEDMWTEEVANSLYKTGQWLQDELQKVAAGTALQVAGVGSLMALHFSSKAI